MNKLKQTSMLNRNSKISIETVKDTIFREPNLIGIAGKSGAGKDLIGRIIQYLTNPSTKDSEKEFEIGNDYSSNCPFEVRKFADKLKDIVCMLIGCTREQLEDREFKEKELGEEWWYWKVFSLKYNYNEYTLFSFNEEDKAKTFAFQFHGTNINPYIKLIKLTPRLLLQLLGTECGREILHPNIWENTLFNEYEERKPKRGKSFDYRISECIDCKKPFAGEKRQFICHDCYDTHNWFPNWVITDVRFKNEVEAIKKRGGITIGVHRDLNKGNAHIAPIPHKSETDLDDYQDFDYVIQNDGTIPDLILKVEEILLKERVI